MVLDRIYSSDICTQAQFIPDSPVVLEAGELLTLTNAEFYIDDKKVEGHWVDLRYVKEKENGN